MKSMKLLSILAAEIFAPGVLQKFFRPQTFYFFKYIMDGCHVLLENMESVKAKATSSTAIFIGIGITQESLETGLASFSE